MVTAVVLLRGINLGSRNRVAMPALRDALAQEGMADARTHLQSGNIVLGSALPRDELADSVSRLVKERFGLDVPAVVRTADELAQVIAENPFPEAARLAPKLLQVSFFSAPLGEQAAARVRAVSSGEFLSDSEAISLARSNQYAYGWHPDGIHRSKLARELSDRRLGVIATARNWSTVITLMEMAASHAG